MIAAHALAALGYTEEPPQHPVITRHLGGREVRLTLDIGAIGELERLTGRGIGDLVKRFAMFDFAAKDVIETIRLGLIGGGETAANALAVTHVFVAPRLGDHVRLASDIATAAFQGLEPEAEGEAPAGDDAEKKA